MTTPDPFSWQREERLQAIFDALEDEGTARCVGGCVRDSLLGLDPLTSDDIDIDIATDRTPAEMKALFQRAGIRWVATGEDHGTITAIYRGLVAECTTLRADVVTDGRHAEVRFTRDWDEDWRRRDFTINALYTDRWGGLWDPAGGVKDLEAERVAFIGAPADRIVEDALRILRFFRFSARFARDFDESALQAIAARAELIDILSKERIWSELSRTFSARKAPEALEKAADAGVLARVLGDVPRLDIFRRLHDGMAPPSPTSSVAALWPGLSRDTLRRAFKPPAAFLDAYQNLHKALAAYESGTSGTELLYRFGRDTCAEALRIAAAQGSPVDPGLVKTIRERAVPVLPIGGKDLVSRGLTPGPEIGEIIDHFERQWLNEDAPTDDQAVEAILAKVLGSKAPR